MSNNLVNSSTRSLTESIFYSFRDSKVTINNLILQIKKKAYEYDAAFTHFLLIKINDSNSYILLLVDKSDTMSTSIYDLIKTGKIYDYIISFFVLDGLGREELKKYYIVSQATMDEFDRAMVFFDIHERSLFHILTNVEKKDIEIFACYGNDV